MRRLYCDLHIHSCLSPCGDDSMTPAVAAGMLKLAGIDVAALTDHNSVKNCPAFFEACHVYGVSPLAGMELTTAEDIHLVCLADTCEKAFDFAEAVEQCRVRVKNKPKFFGNQFIMDAEDNIIAEEENLLPNATTLPIAEAFALATSFGLVCYPAHIDREANGIIAVLGDFPPTPEFRFAEFRDIQNLAPYREKYHRLNSITPLFGSDAHSQEGICDAGFSLNVGESGEPAGAVFEFLRGGGT